MKNKIHRLVILVFLLINLASFNGCEMAQNEPTGSQKLTTVSFDYQHFGCVMNYVNMQHDSVYVINCKEEFEKYFPCDNNPQIDFNAKTLLVSFGNTTNGVGNILTQLSLADNTYSLMVDITLSFAAVAQAWHIAVIVDKINTSSVILDIIQHF